MANNDDIREATTWSGFTLLAIIVVCVALSFIGYFTYAYFNPKYTAVQYQTFKQSQQYNDGMAQELEQFRQDYYATGVTAEQRDNIRESVLHDFAAYDDTKLSPSLRAFLDQMRGTHE